MPEIVRSREVSSVNRAELALMLLGPSAAMGDLWRRVRSLAPHARTVLLTGSPDRGQEAVAWLIHELSSGSHRPLLTLCGQEAEDRFTLTNAGKDFRPAAFVFLPEVDQLSPAAQDGLLQLLRTRNHRTFSVVAGVSEDFEKEVSMGRFSAELAEILRTVQIEMPSLKDRLEDLPILLGQMLASRCQTANRPVPRLSEELLRAAMQHAWPGNLQELSEVVESLLVRAGTSQELRAADLKYPLRPMQERKPAAVPVRMIPLDIVAREHCFAVLSACKGNKLRAAEVLGISRSTLYRVLDAEKPCLSLVS